MVYLGRESILSRKIERLQADRIAIGPPASAFEQQFIAKEVGETGIGGKVFVLENPVRGTTVLRFETRSSAS